MAKQSPQDFETRMRRLQEIVQELERGELPLERNVALYKEGRALARSCGALLEHARHEVLLCDAEGGESAENRENSRQPLHAEPVFYIVHGAAVILA